MSAQIKLSKEDCALSMGQRRNYAAVKDAQVLLDKEESAEDTANVAAVKDAQIKLGREECAFSMGQRRNPNDAALMGAQIKFRWEEYVGDTAQRRNGASLKDVQIKLSKG